MKNSCFHKDSVNLLATNYAYEMDHEASQDSLSMRALILEGFVETLPYPWQPPCSCRRLHRPSRKTSHPRLQCATAAALSSGAGTAHRLPNPGQRVDAHYVAQDPGSTRRPCLSGQQAELHCSCSGVQLGMFRAVVFFEMRGSCCSCWKWLWKLKKHSLNGSLSISGARLFRFHDCWVARKIYELINELMTRINILITRL